MSECIGRDDLEVDEQLELSPQMSAMIESYADQVGYVMPKGGPTSMTGSLSL